MTDQSPNALPPEIEVTDLGDGVRYLLPQRIRGSLRWIGLLPLGVGLIFLAAPGTVAVGGIVALVGGNVGPEGWVGGLCGLLFLIPFFLVGAIACWFGLNLLVGDVEIEVREGQLRSAARAIKLRWVGRRRLDNLSRLVLVGIYKRADGATEPPQQWASVRVDCVRGGPLTLATGYPITLLTPLANDLARRCRAAGAEFLPVVTEVRQRRPGSDPDIVLGYVSAGAPEEVGRAAENLFKVERTDQPKGSQIVVEQDDVSVTLTIPPTGMRGTHLGQLVIGLVMSLGLATITFLVVLYGVNQIQWGGLLCGFPIDLLFIAIGLFLVATAIDGSRRRAIVAVAGGRLMILTQGPFGTRRQEWPVAAVADVRPGPSGTVINNVPVLELQVLPREGAKFGLLASREVSELEWIATRLRRSLGLTPATPPTAGAEAPAVGP